MGDLSQVLADAAMNAVDRAEAEVYVGQRSTRADLRWMAEAAVVAAVLETLADGIESANWPMSISKLRAMAAEVKEADGG